MKESYAQAQDRITAEINNSDKNVVLPHEVKNPSVVLLPHTGYAMLAWTSHGILREVGISREAANKALVDKMTQLGATFTVPAPDKKSAT